MATAKTAKAYAYINSRGQEYFLHGKVVTLKGGREQQIYFFAKDIREDTAVAEKPATHEVIENERTGLPMLRTIKA